MRKGIALKFAERIEANNESKPRQPKKSPFNKRKASGEA